MQELIIVNQNSLNKTAVYTSAQVRELDRIAIQEFGIPGYALMERAGTALFAAACAHWRQVRSVCVLCGAGNNGGDGYVFARLARGAGWQVMLYSLVETSRLQGDAARACQDFLAEGGEVIPFAGSLPDADLLVDALLGTGLTRTVEGIYAEAIRVINQHPAPVVAADIPSGLQADTGQPCGVAVEADLTMTFIGMKAGLLTGQARDYCGKVLLEGLDLPPEVIGRIPTDLYTIPETAVATALPPRKRCTHKGSFGHTLLVGGSAGMSGAIRLAGEAALRTGSGLVTLATDVAHAAWINLHRPELMVRPVAAANELRLALAGKTVIGIGPGLGKSPWAQTLLHVALDAGLPLVVDADALNLLAGMNRWQESWVLTPHPAEAARLLACSTVEVEADRVVAARRLQARFGGVVVLKGAGTVVASPAGVAFCTAGNPGMASGGMGDVLTGIISSLLAQGLSLQMAAETGVQVHAQAADRAAAQQGERGLLASDVIGQLQGVVNS